MRAGQRQLLSRLTTGFLIVAGSAIFAIGVASRAADLHFQTVLSGSMRPTISPGDVAVTQPVPISSLRVGDVIAFYPPGRTQADLHRIVALQNGTIRTRGDANSADDPWILRPSGTTAYRLVAVVPFAGWLTPLRWPALLLAALLLAVSLLVQVGKGVRTRASRPQPQAGS